MGRGKFKGGRGGSKGRGGKQGGGGGGGAPRYQPRVSFAEVKKDNELFERFYNELNIVPEGQEREQFWAALRRELPNSFRFCGSKGHALAVQKNLTDRYIPQITSVQFNDGFVEAPQPLPWFPSGLAWQMTTPKQIIRKFPPFAAFQKYLVSETTVGNISRQEAVSMIPPLLLDVEPHHTVLDLCAAPGSKSAQLIEALHAGEEARMRTVLQEIESNGTASPAAINPADKEEQGNDWEDDGRATGLLVANDVNYQRAQMLVHQIKRLNSPNLIVMNHDATLFPSIELPPQTKANGPSRGKWLKFDRVLADVPCSGDGTCRKNPGIWKDWLPGNALGLHTIQVRILVRSLQMLKVGGRVVYSTCSLNPLENESVISSAINRCGGLDKVAILDCSDRLPALRRNPGLKKWHVMDKEGKIWNSWDDVEDAQAKKFEAALEKLTPGMFPLNDDYPLNRCMRVYPHQQDTGGFFITVLEKKSEIRTRPESDIKKVSAAPSVVSIAKEIEATPADEGIIPKLETVEEFTGTKGDKADLADAGNTTAAQRQNKEPVERPPAPSVKRVAEESTSETARTKRAKLELDDQDTEVIGEVGQMEHWPPPPTNQAAYVDIGERVAGNPPVQNQVNGIALTKRKNGVHEESFKYLAPDHPELLNIYKFYDLPERFPRDRFMVRNEAGEPAKAIYYTTQMAKEILTKNEGRGMKFVHSGVKMFVKQDAQGPDTCRWRIQTEGLPIIEGWVGERRIVRLYKKSTLQFLLREMFPKSSAPELAETREHIQNMDLGCHVMRIEPSKGEDGFDERMVLPIWRSMASVNLMLPKEDRKAMLLRIFNDDTPLVDHSQQQRRKPDDDEMTSADAGLDGVQPETTYDSEDGGVKLNPDAEEEGENVDATAPIGEAGIGTEEDANATEDKLRAEQQRIADEKQEIATMPEREGEEDKFNTTV